MLSRIFRNQSNENSTKFVILVSSGYYILQKRYSIIIHDFFIRYKHFYILKVLEICYKKLILQLHNEQRSN